MEKPSLILAGVILVLGVYCSNSSFAESLSVQPMLQKSQNEEEEQVKSILDERIKTTCILDQGFLRTKGDTEYVDVNLATNSGVYIPYVLGISCFPFSLASRNPHAFDLAGIVNETTIYTIQRRSDKNIGDYFVYDFYVAYNDAKPFEDGDDIFFAVNEAHEKAKLPTPSDTEGVAAWDWHLAGLEIRVAKRLSAKDFEGISIGSTIEDVISVDPITAMSQPDGDSLAYDLLKFDTFHYTDDGILKISFARKAVSEEFLVSEIELNKTFEFCYNGNPAVDGQPTVKLKISPEHLPN